MSEGTILPISGLSKRFTAESAREWLAARSKPQPNGCITVTGYGSTGGNIKLHQKGMGRAWLHVVSYVLHHGPVPPGLVIHHTCEVKACIRPDHLEAVTQGDNILDALRRKRPNGSCDHPRERVNGRLKRCRPCNADHQARWRERQMNG